MAEEFVKAQIKGDKVVVFLKPTCSYCILAKDVLSKYSFRSGRLEFIDISVLDNMGAIQDYLQRVTGARTVSDSTLLFSSFTETLYTFLLSDASVVQNRTHF